jgi:hypothetical protein
VIEHVFYDILQADRGVVRIRSEVQRLMRSADADLRWLTYADMLLYVGGESLFDRKKVEGAISVGPQGPRVNRGWLVGELRKKRTNVGKFRLMTRRVKLRPGRDCYGKVVSLLAYRILAHLIKKHSRHPSLAKHYGTIFLIRGFLDLVVSRRGSPASKYYFSHISKVTI